MAEATAYCPRCDKPFKAARKRDAIQLVEEHVKRAHPEHYEDFKEG